MSRNLTSAHQQAGSTSLGALSTGGGDQPLPQSISTPFGYFPSHSTPDPKTFQHEASSGYYFDPATGYYYDPKTDYYYQPKTGQWHFWCARYSTYIPCEGGDVERKLRLQEEEKAERAISQAAVIQAAPALTVPGGGMGGAINEPFFSNLLPPQDHFVNQPSAATTEDLLATCLDDQRQLIAELRLKLPVGHPELARMEAKLRRLEESVAAGRSQRGAMASLMGGGGHPSGLSTWRDPPASWRADDNPSSVLMNNAMMGLQAPPAMPTGAPLPPIFSSGMPPAMQQPMGPSGYDPLQAMDTFVAFQQQLQQQVNQHLISQLVPQQLVSVPNNALHSGVVFPQLAPMSSQGVVGRNNARSTTGPVSVRRSPERRGDGRPSRFESMSERERKMRLGGGGGSGSRSRPAVSSSHSTSLTSSSRTQRSSHVRTSPPPSSRQQERLPLDEQLRADLKKREEEELAALNICGNCARRNHRREKCASRAVSSDVVRRELERARQEKAREEMLKEDLRKTADEYRCRRHDLIIQRLRGLAPHGLITREHVRNICPKCSRLGHVKESCTATEQVDIRVLKRVREEVAAFSRTFWVYLQDNCTIDFSRKFATFDLMDAIEASVDGVDPVSVQLRDKCAANGGYVTGGQELALCSKCAQLGHSRSSCNYSDGRGSSGRRESDSATDRQHHEKMLSLVTAYRTLCAEAKKEGKPGFKLGGRAAREEAEKKKKRRRGNRAGEVEEDVDAEPVAEEDDDDDDVIVLSDDDDEDVGEPVAVSAMTAGKGKAKSPTKAPSTTAVPSEQNTNQSGGEEEDDDEVVELIEVDEEVEEQNDPLAPAGDACGDQSAAELKDVAGELNAESNGTNTGGDSNENNDGAKEATNGMESETKEEHDLVILEGDD